MKRFFSLIRRHKIKSIIGAVTVTVLALLISRLFVAAPIEYITADARKDDLLQVVEAVGTISSERDLALKFPVVGIVKAVYVKEGDTVVANQKLAELRNGDLAADIASASAGLRSAQADLAALEEGSRPEDIAINEAQVANAKAALITAESQLATAEGKLVALTREAETSLAGIVSTSLSSISQNATTAINALNVIEDVFSDRNLQDAIQKHEPGKDVEVMGRQRSALLLIDAAIAAKLSAQSADEALVVLRQARDGISAAADALNTAYTTLSFVPETPYYTSSIREMHKATLSTQRSGVQSALSALDSAMRQLQDNAAGYDTQIASAQGEVNRTQSDILTYETTIRIQEAQLALKKAGTRKADLDAARARVSQQYASMQRAQARYQDTILFAPIAGNITKVNLNVGEFTGDFDNFENSITMLGDSPYRVEMFVAEIDIPKIHLSQSGSINLDAFPGIDYALRVSEIDPAATSVDGVPKYQVKLDFVYAHDVFKIGMTGDAEIVTDARENVILIPARAVSVNDEDEQTVRVLKADNSVEVRVIKTGLEGVTDIEVIEGIEVGEKIVILQK